MARTASRHELGWKQLHASSTPRRGWTPLEVVGVLVVTALWLYLLGWALDVLLQGLR